ncbi:MAG: type IV secretion system protein [Pseudomonadota bacterium]
MKNIKSILGFIRPANAKLFAIFILTFLVAFSVLSVDNNASAASQCTVGSDGQTTPEFVIQVNSLVKDIIMKVTLRLFAISEMMYSKIISTPGYFTLIPLTVSLFLAIYGILFVTGMAQIKLYDFVIMLIKIGIIFMLFTPTAWLFFSNNVVRFFNEGTIELINYFTKTSNIHPAVADIPVIGPVIKQALAATMAFSAIDSAINKLFSSQMFVILMAAASSEKYGLLMGAIMALSLWLCLMSLLTAVWVYIMSLIMKTLLFGLAPIFIPTILFKRTRHLFDNWLNQIVSASLQPVLLFIFFIFFVQLMENSIDNILAHPVCWTKLNSGWRGTPMDWYYWRFAKYDSTNGWMPNPDEQKAFPIPIIHILTFLLVAELANRFNKVVIQIAQQISQASVSLAYEGGGLLQSAMGGFTRNKRSTFGFGNNPSS